MESMWLYTSFCLFLAVLAYKLLSTPRCKPPPRPALAIPVIGHLHLLKQPLHRTLHRLSEKLGPIFSLQLGTRFVLVVSSPSAAEECFTKNDIVFANRPRFVVGKYIAYDHTSLVTAPYGEHWHNLRRLCSTEIFSSGRLNAFLSIRQNEAKLLLQKIYRITRSGEFARVELRPLFSELSFNTIMRMMTGKRYFGDDEDEEGKHFRELIEELFEASGVSYPGDFLPFLRWIDYNSYDKKTARLSEKMDAFFQGLIQEHRRNKSESTNTMINHLLDLQESHPEYYTDTVIKGLIMVMLTAGTDTTSVTIEWVLSVLLNNPQKLENAKEEIDSLVGNTRLIEESDFSKLHYLQAIISETFRLFPAAPLLVPHESSDNCTIGGYDVPRGTMLLVNAWAIHRDPTVWDDPTCFKPERFEVGEVGPPKLMPFGMGRSSCPGAGLAERVVRLAVGSLIQSFEWQKVNDEKIDLTEGTGLSMPKAVPLRAMCKARSVLQKVI